MTAFAAILALDGRRCDRDSTALVGQQLTSVAGADAARVSEGPCDLLLAPLHADDPHTPLRSASGPAITGQVLLENPSGLASQLSAPPDTPDLGLALLAYQRWGDAFTTRLNGEFALAVWDARTRTLFCARDGLGVRLLYLAHGTDTLIATNALTAALAHPDVPDALDEVAEIEFLACGGPRDDIRTTFEHVRLVPAGHTLEIPFARPPQLHRHWRFPSPEPAVTMRPQEALDGYRDALRNAVADRVRGRRLSIFLSGGIDSTTIAAAARASDNSDRLRAITSVYTRFSTIDELRYARLAADALQIPLTVVPADAHEALAAQRDGLPTPEPLDEPTLSDWRDTVAHAATHATIGLYGEDGDAVFLPPGGAALWRSGGLRLLGPFARHAISARHLPYLGLRLRDRLARMREPRRSAARPPAWLRPAAAQLIVHASPATILGLTPEPLPAHPFRPGTQDRLVATVPGVLAPLISSEVTRQRIELRFPLLDARLLTFVMSVPPIPWCQNKALPRAAYRDRLPREISRRPKTPVTGFYDALVASWKSRREPSPVPDSMREWVDEPAWSRAQRSPDPLEVMRSWRVLELDDWVSRRARRQLACTR